MNIVGIFLVVSIIANIRLAYCLGKHYRWKDEDIVKEEIDVLFDSGIQGGRKHLYEKIEKEECCDSDEDDKISIRLNNENNISNKDK